MNSRSAVATAGGVAFAASTIEKNSVFAPMANVNENTAVAANAEFFRIIRQP